MKRNTSCARVWKADGQPVIVKRYYFEFTDMPNVVWIDLDKLNLDSGAPVLKFDLAGDLEASGEVSGKFKPTSPAVF